MTVVSRWLIACLTLFIIGVWLLATLPVTDPAWQLVAGWGSLLAAMLCLVRAIPEDGAA